MKKDKFNKSLIAKDKKIANKDCKCGVHDWSNIICNDEISCINCGMTINLKDKSLFNILRSINYDNL